MSELCEKANAAAFVEQSLAQHVSEGKARLQTRRRHSNRIAVHPIFKTCSQNVLLPCHLQQKQLLNKLKVKSF